MRKKLLSILALLFTICSLGFAATQDPFIIIKKHCITVDLAENKYKSHIDNAQYSSSSIPSNLASNSANYYDSQILAVIGIDYTKGKNLPVTITMELVSGEWSYIYDDRYKRPFGVDLFARKADNIGSDGLGFPDSDGNFNLHFGHQENANSGTNIQTATIPANIATKYDSIWWDACLVMDPIVDTNTNTVLDENGVEYHLTASDTFYTAQLKVTISCGTSSETYNIFLQGYYKISDTDDIDTDTSLMMTVERLSTANTLDITELATSKASQPVARYGYTTTEKQTSDTSGKVSVFLSSASDAFGQNPEEFRLRHINANGQTSVRDTANNSIVYRATLTSQANASKADDGSTRSVTYDGTDYFGNPNTPSRYMTSSAELMMSHNSNYVIWRDNGEISVTIPSHDLQGNPVDASRLVSGQYISNIYIHVVTDNL